ncbi:MAG: aldo/keto reductase [Pseudomonadota bacterium]
MRTICIGQSDLEVGAIAYGCWRFASSTVDEATAKIRAALNLGMTLIDTADIYGFGEPAGFGGAERILGDVLRADPSLRKRMVLATKGGITIPTPYNSSYDYLMDAMDASLERLGVEHVDLYMIHRPDLTAPVEETARALNHMVSSGKTRYLGVSNHTVPQMRALEAHLEVSLISTQPEFSALHQDPITDGTLDWCAERRATALAWSPLGGGSLATGVAGQGADKAMVERVMGVVDRLAETHGATRTQIALAFTMAHGVNVVPIIGTQTISRMEEAAGAAHVSLGKRDFYDLVEAYRGEGMP